MLTAQLLGDGKVAAYVAQTDRRGEVQRPLRASGGPLPAVDRQRSADPVQGLVENTVDGDRLTALRGVAVAVEGHQRPAGQLGQPCAVLDRDHPVVACRARPRPGSALPRTAPAPGAPRPTTDLDAAEGLAVDAVAPADEVLDQLGRVGLGHHLVEEEVDEPRDSHAATSTCCTDPSRRPPPCPRPSGRTTPSARAGRARARGSRARSRPRPRPGRGARLPGRAPAGCPATGRRPPPARCPSRRGRRGRPGSAAARVYAASSAGRSDAPLPRGS